MKTEGSRKLLDDLVKDFEADSEGLYLLPFRVKATLRSKL